MRWWLFPWDSGPICHWAKLQSYREWAQSGSEGVEISEEENAAGV